MPEAIISPHLGSQLGGSGGGLITFRWEESSDLEASNDSGRQWSLGDGAEGGTLYVPVDMEVAHLSLEIRYRDPDSTTDIIQGPVTVSLHQVDGGDDVNDDDVSEITGTAVSFSAIANGTGKRRGTAVVGPDGVVILAGTWIRPQTTAPRNAIAADTGNRANFTVGMREV